MNFYGNINIVQFLTQGRIKPKHKPCGSIGGGHALNIDSFQGYEWNPSNGTRTSREDFSSEDKLLNC